MIVLHKKSDLPKYISRIEGFERLYNNAFPDANEREDFDTILNRIETNKFDEDAKTFMVLSEHGGMVVEFYPSADSLLITYITVDENSRQKGAGSELLNEGLQRIRKIISEHNPKSHHITVFLEVNNPHRTEQDSFSPINRYEFFRKNGAKKIDIEYVQPSLGAGKARVSNLDLLTIPEEGDKLKNKQLYRFLHSFYRELGAADPAADTDFKAMNLIEDDEFAKLKELDLFYTYEFYNCSVAVHIPLIIEDSEDSFCLNFKSFEHDLMSYCYQNNDFIHSRVVEKFARNITLTFPNEIKYTSEGRNESTVVVNSSNILPCRVSANITSVRKHYSVVTFVFQPERDKFFTEYDIIKLSSMFGSKQEQTNLINEIFIGEETLKSSFSKWIDEIFEKISTSGDQNPEQTFDFDSLSKNISGTVVLNIDENNSFTKHLSVFQDLDLHRNESIKKAEKEFGSIENRDCKLMCAFLLGIFDFNRLNTEEIVDTLVPVNTSAECAMFVNRGCLLVLKRNDDIFPQIKESIGINPYYILPFIVVTHNEFMMYNAREAVQPNPELKQSQLEKNILDARRFLLDMVEGVFEYPSENRIIEYVNKERHIPQLLADINLQIQAEKEKLEFRKSKRLLSIEGIIGLVLLLFGIIQVSGAILDILTDFSVPIPPFLRLLIIVPLSAFGVYLFYHKTKWGISLQRNK